MNEKTAKRARQLRAVLHFFSSLPLPLVHFIGAAAGLILSVTPNQLRRISLINIELCYPDRGRRWRRGVMRKSLMEAGKVFAEYGPLWFWNKQRVRKLITQVYDQNFLEDGFKEGKGLLIAMPRMGAWELASQYLSSRLPMTIMYEPSRIAELAPLMHSARKHYGTNFVPADASGIKAVAMALAKGQAVGLLPDQEPKRGNGCFAFFFEESAYTSTLLSILGRRKRVPVVFSVMERLPFGGGYSMHNLHPGDEIYDVDPKIAAAAINRCVEKCISIAPEQFMWSYKRFEALTWPEGSVRSYDISWRESFDAHFNAISGLVPFLGFRRKQRYH